MCMCTSNWNRMIEFGFLCCVLCFEQKAIVYVYFFSLFFMVRPSVEVIRMGSSYREVEKWRIKLEPSILMNNWTSLLLSSSSSFRLWYELFEMLCSQFNSKLQRLVQCIREMFVIVRSVHNTVAAVTTKI